MLNVKNNVCSCGPAHNVNQDHVTVIDRRKRMFAEVYFRNNHVTCELCEEENCEHVKYALACQRFKRLCEKKAG